jgi:putative membrane protein
LRQSLGDHYFPEKGILVAILSTVLVALVAIEHMYILILEMFMWTTPRARKAFGTTESYAEQTSSLAANQGLYNGFLAAGLVWGLIHPNMAFGHQLQIFFLSCVIVAAIYGGATAKRSILIVQGLPAIAGLAAVLAA